MDYFELSTPEDLYSEIKEAYSSYSVSLSNRDMLFLVFSLNHLCEWIAGGKKYKDVCRIQETYRTKGQKFLMEIWRVQEFKVINTLCNRGKHHLTAIFAQQNRGSNALGTAFFCIHNNRVKTVPYSLHGSANRNKK